MIRLLLILMLLQVALPCAITAQSVDLNPAPTTLTAADLPLDLHLRMDYLPDPGARMTPEEALESPDWQPLRQLNFGYLGYPVWTRVTLSAEAESLDVLLQYKRMALIDLYLLHPGTPIAQYQLGHRQVLHPAAIRYRFPVLPLHLESGRPVTLLTRIYCIGPIEVGSRISGASAILHQDTWGHLIWGAICGMMIAVVLSSLIVWHGLRQRLVLAYAAIAMTSLLAILTVKGLIPLTSYPALNSLAAYSSWVFSNLMPVTMIVFAMVFFATKKALPFLHRWLTLLLGVNLVLTAAWLAAPWYPLFYRYTALLGGATFLTGVVLTGVGLVGLRRGIRGSGYYLLGQGSFFLSLQFQLLGQFGLLQRQEILDFVIPVGATLDIVFLAKAISLRLSDVKSAIHQRRRELEQRSRESSFGKMVGMVIHQWRAPLARQAAMVMETKLRLTRSSPARQDLERFTEVLLPRMRDNVEQMEKTHQEFEALFTGNDQLLSFNPDSIVDQALSVVSGSELPAPLQTIRNRPEDLQPILNYPFALTQVILTLIENACDIMRERKISNPEINISLSQAADMSVTISVRDNGGGITLSPASGLFDPFVSGKRQPGTGVGLYIAKSVVELRLRGTITALNTCDGACFTLTVPDRTPLGQ
ncbi:sensor histidine kinase [Geoalkalibacter halelectricus]|uniref:histidine kinase n=1 Tax=Geoalkalibacter halelectricus TaxID=2847045 RepID=A0ABY5ZLV7_9BACT|nr:sensor histidine kinase [Geoalkalibacter halelectricus]MDO3380198.1 sensor histidine kinase [Geoalkalibacter halelectricus]UWZ78231.1 sensor histidine kinase [Geoalkalibacter halelectricus]